MSQYYFYTSNIFLPALGTNLLAWSVEVLADLLGYCLLSYDFLLSMHLVMTVQSSTVQHNNTGGDGLCGHHSPRLPRRGGGARQAGHGRIQAGVVEGSSVPCILSTNTFNSFIHHSVIY